MKEKVTLTICDKEFVVGQDIPEDVVAHEYLINPDHAQYEGFHRGLASGSSVIPESSSWGILEVYSFLDQLQDTE